MEWFVLAAVVVVAALAFLICFQIAGEGVLLLHPQSQVDLDHTVYIPAESGKWQFAATAAGVVFGLVGAGGTLFLGIVAIFIDNPFSPTS